LEVNVHKNPTCFSRWSVRDIEFNPNKSVNCQAMAVATCVGLYKSGNFMEAIKSKEDFYNIVYKNMSSKL